jgi:hypothetical protein
VALSSDPDKRARQLANLRPAPAAPVGNHRTRRHGGYAQVSVERIEGRAREVFDALAADAPLRDEGGELPAVDHAAVHLLAQSLCRLEDVAGHLAATGWIDQRTGEPRQSVLDLEARLRREAASMLDRLGMTPASRARLGLDLVRVFDAAGALSEPDPVHRAELLRRAGVFDA